MRLNNHLSEQTAPVTITPVETNNNNNSINNVSEGADDLRDWRTRAFHKLRDVIPETFKHRQRSSKKKTKKKATSDKQSLHEWFESQRKTSLASLDSSDRDEKVSNLKELLALPLDVDDLQSILRLGVEPALKGQDASDAQLLAYLETDAEFLTRLLLDGDSAMKGTTSIQAERLLARLENASTGTARTSNAVSNYNMAKNKIFVGKTAQITAIVLMVAQVLIGAQLLRRFRKRKTSKRCSAAVHSGSIPNRRMSASMCISTYSSERRKISVSSHILPPEPETEPPSLDTTLDSPEKVMQTPPRQRNGNSNPSLSNHLDRETNKAKAAGTKGHDDNDDDNDNRTAETDSLSVSDGVQLKGDQNLSPGPTAAALIADHQRQMDLLAQLSFSSGTPCPPLPSSCYKPAAAAATQNSLINACIPSRPMIMQDKFAQRMSKLKTDLLTVKEEQTSKLQDSTMHVQEKCQETITHYDELSKRLEKLTQSIQTRTLNATGATDTTTVGAPLLDEAQPDDKVSDFSRRSTTKTSNRGPLIMINNNNNNRIDMCTSEFDYQSDTSLQSIQLLEAKAEVKANDEDQAELLKKVSSLQQDLKGQQERHALILQQREAKMAELSKKIEFLGAELDRRNAHARTVKVEQEQDSDMQQRIFVLQKELDFAKQNQEELTEELTKTKRTAAEKELECQQLLAKLRNVTAPSAELSLVYNETTAKEHQELIADLQRQLVEQEEMNKKTLEMAQMLESKRAEVIKRSCELEAETAEIEARRAKLKIMEETAAAHNISGSTASNGDTTEELEAQYRELQQAYNSQSLECSKLTELLSNKTKQLAEMEAKCLDLTEQLEEMTEQLSEKDARIEQLEQDVQDKDDLKAQNAAITKELQVQQELQVKMNQTTLEMIQLLEDRGHPNTELTKKLDSLSTELSSVNRKH